MSSKPTMGRLLVFTNVNFLKKSVKIGLAAYPCIPVARRPHPRRYLRSAPHALFSYRFFMSPAHHTRVLIVDDNRDAADLLSELLIINGYTTRTAYDGFMALDAAMSFEPQIVILDLGMPKYSGNEVAPMLRQVKKLENAYIIALTAWGDAESRALTSRTGFDLHLTKSVTMQELLGAVKAGRMRSATI